MGKFKYNPFTDELDRVDLTATDTDIDGTDKSVLFVDDGVLGEDAEFQYNKTTNQIEFGADNAGINFGPGDGTLTWDGDQFVLHNLESDSQILKLRGPKTGGTSRMIKFDHSNNMTLAYADDTDIKFEMGYVLSEDKIRFAGGSLFSNNSANISLPSGSWTFLNRVFLTNATSFTNRAEEAFVAQVTTTGTADVGLGIQYRFDIEMDDGDLLQACRWGATLTDPAALAPKTKLFFELKNDATATYQNVMEIRSEGRVGFNKETPDSTVHAVQKVAADDILELNGAASQTGKFATFLDSSSNERFSVESDGEVIQNDRPLLRYSMMGA